MMSLSPPDYGRDLDGVLILTRSFLKGVGALSPASLISFYPVPFDLSPGELNTDRDQQLGDADNRPERSSAEAPPAQ